MMKYTTLSRQTVIRVVCFSLLILFAAHAFCFFNLTFSSPSVMFRAISASGSQTAGGAYLQPFYWRIRGDLAAPLLVGLLTAAYITMSALLTADLLHLKKPLPIFMLCGALIANSAVTSELAAHLHTADALFLSQLFASLGVFLCMRLRFGLIPGAAFIAAALSMHSGGLACAASLALIVCITDLLRGEDFKDCLIRIAKTLLGLAGGCALYACGYVLILRLRGLDAEAALQLPYGANLRAMWFAPIRTLIAPLTAYTRANIIVRALLAALCLFTFACSACRMDKKRLAALLLLSLLVPLAAGLPIFSSAPAGQYPLSFAYLDVFAAALLCTALDVLPSARRLLRGAAGAFAVLFLGAIVFSNQVYLKKNLEMQSTLSVMTRVIDRAEHTEGYRPGYTPVSIIGTLEESAFSIPHQGFEHLAALDAASANYVIASYEDAIWYTYQILGYPLNFISVYEQSQMSESDAVKAMPAFPAEGCVQFVNDTLVIKLSD